MNRKQRKGPGVNLPPEVLAKLWEVAALMILADAMRRASKQGRSILVTFPKGEPPTASFVPPPTDTNPEGA